MAMMYDIGSEGAMMIMQEREEQLRNGKPSEPNTSDRVWTLVLQGAAIAAEIDRLLEEDEDNAST